MTWLNQYIRGNYTYTHISKLAINGQEELKFIHLFPKFCRYSHKNAVYFTSCEGFKIPNVSELEYLVYEKKCAGDKMFLAHEASRKDAVVVV